MFNRNHVGTQTDNKKHSNNSNNIAKDEEGKNEMVTDLQCNPRIANSKRKCIFCRCPPKRTKRNKKSVYSKCLDFDKCVQSR